MTAQKTILTDAMLDRVARAIYEALEKADEHLPYLNEYPRENPAERVVIIDGDFDLIKVAQYLCEEIGIEPHTLRADHGTKPR